MNSDMKKSVRSGLILVGTAALIAGCSVGAVTTNHGHLLSNEELQQIQPGMGKEQVRMALGTPDTTSTVGGGAYYYIASKTEAGPFIDPTVKERRVAAVYFNEVGTVTRVANYGLQDGKVIDFITRKTPSHGNDDSILKQLFRNLGKGGLPGIAS